MTKRSIPEFPTWACSLYFLVFSLHIAEVAAADDPSTPSILPPVVLNSAAPTVLLTTIPGSAEIIFPDDDGFHLSDRVVDLLGQRAGVYTDSPGGRGSRSSVYIRGLDPNHTLVLRDGIPVNDPTNLRGGSFDFSTLDSAMVERIEILRGPASAVYGSDAIGGAINIVTKSGRSLDRADTEVVNGSWGLKRATFSTSGARGPVDLAVGGAWTDEGVPSKLGRFEDASFDARVGVNLDSVRKLVATLHFLDAQTKAFPEFSGGTRAPQPVGFERRGIHELASGISIEIDRIGQWDWLQSNLQFQTYQRRESVASPTVPPGPSGDFVPGQPDTRQRLQRYTASMTTRANTPDRRIFAVVGADAKFDEGKTKGDLDFLGTQIPDAASFDLERWLGGGFFGIDWLPIQGLRSSVVVRIDGFDDYATQTTPRVGILYHLPLTTVDLVASWGEGFKLPSFYALGSPTVGNSELRPERSESWEAGFDFTLCDPSLGGKFRYFDSTVKDLIDFSVDTFRLENLSKVRASGFELEFRKNWKRQVEFRQFVTLTDARDQLTNNRLRNRPRWRGGAAATWSPDPRVSFRIEALFVSEFLDASILTDLVELDGYQRFDIGVTYHRAGPFDVSLFLGNITDERYEQAVGFRDPGFSVRLGVEIPWVGDGA